MRSVYELTRILRQGFAGILVVEGQGLVGRHVAFAEGQTAVELYLPNDAVVDDGDKFAHDSFVHFRLALHFDGANAVGFDIQLVGECRCSKYSP